MRPAAELEETRGLGGEHAPNERRGMARVRRDRALERAGLVVAHREAPSAPRAGSDPMGRRPLGPWGQA